MIPHKPLPDTSGPEPGPDPEASYLAELGQRVRHKRSLRGMSRKTLSRQAQVSERYLADLESGAGNISITLLRRVAKAMGVPIADLVADEDPHADWTAFRDLLRGADPRSIEAARRILVERAASAGGVETVERVALIGLRGAGKSTLGRIAAQRLGWTFVELNAVVEEVAGFSVTEIFRLYGQEGYRRLEQRALRDVIERPGPLILATGGGIVSETPTFELLLSSFYTIWVRARPDQHMTRVREQGDLRPMGDDRAAMDELQAILSSREPLYGRADSVLDTESGDVEQSASDLARLISMARPAMKDIS